MTLALRLGVDAVATIVESYVGTGWANRLVQVELARSARLRRAVRVIADAGFVSTRDEVSIGQGASYVCKDIRSNAAPRAAICCRLEGGSWVRTVIAATSWM